MNPKTKNLIARIAVAAVAIPALVFLFIRGGWAWTAFVEVLVILAVWEASRLFQRGARLFPLWSLLVLCVIPPVLFLFYLPMWIAPWVFLVILAVAWHVVRRPDPLAETSDFAGPIAVAVYIGLGFGFLVGVRQTGSDVEGARWLMFLFADLWVADTFAMLFGALWGKKKFSPIVSPNKTMVGFWAGLIGGGIVGAVFILGQWLPASWYIVLIGAVILSGVGQLGDLYESLLKRRAKVKDISSIIPGHGGVLDRFDSALFAAPMLYIYLKLIVY